MKKKLLLTALIPHNNLLYALQDEQRNLCTKLNLLPVYPLICPLDSIGENTEFTAILAKYQKTFQQSAPVLQINPPHFLQTEQKNRCLVRQIEIRNEQNGTYTSLIPHKTLQEGFFTLHTGCFLYGTDSFAATGSAPDTETANTAVSANAATMSPAQTAEVCAPTALPLSVFRLVVLSLTVKGGEDGERSSEPPCVFWTEEHTQWINMRHFQNGK